MNKKTGIILGGVAAAVAVAVVGVVFFLPGEEKPAGPALTGQMQNFILAETIRPRPDISWKDAQGKEVKLADFDGKLVLFNFWATWCAPCIRELPSLNALQESMQGDDFTVIALNIDREGKRVARRMSRRLKLNALPLNLDKENKVVTDLQVRIMPTTILYDRKGREVGKMEGGAEWNGPDARGLVQYFIDNPDYADNLLAP